MCKRSITLIPLFFVVLVSTLVSCGEDRWAEYAPLTAMDEWMDSLMRADYFWYENMPSTKKLNYFITPSSFLSSVKVSGDNVSHVDTIANTTNSYGITAIFKQIGSDTLYNAVVTYVASDSPAARAGLKRGDWIAKVNGNTITSSQKSTILTSGSALTLTLGTYTTTTASDGTTTATVTDSGTTLQMGASTTITDHPVNFYTTVSSGTKKVGYLVYGSFNAGTSDAYNNELRTAFASFKSAGVNDVVLDLRYNAGGNDVGSAQLLATMLVPSEDMGKTFLSLTHSTKQSSKDKTLTFDQSMIGAGANLNLSRVFIITTSKTAQLSEALIAALVPYMTVYTVGGNTAGALGVTEAYTKTGYPYVFYPVTCLAVNSNGETYTTSGIAATTSADDTSNYSTLLAFGNVKETMLAAALNLVETK